MQFSIAGMSGSTAGHTSSAYGAPNGSLATSLSDTLAPAKAHYQPGYMMSTAQSTTSPQVQRMDEVPIVQTKAKMNHILTRGPASDFGMDSMFESSRQRQAMDEDAPPTASVHDIPNFTEQSPARFNRSSTFDPSTSLSKTPRHHRQPSTPSTQVHYVVVFGYPPDKYSVTVEYFRSLGETTDPDPNTEIMNCFRIGYADPGEAMRAVRKNGEVLGGSWMIGAKWADPGQAEALLGYPRSPPLSNATGNTPDKSSYSMAVDDASFSSAVGTPIRLAPSTSAFRKLGAKQAAPVPPAETTRGVVQGSSPQKGMLGQVSDLIFGW